MESISKNADVFALKGLDERQGFLYGIEEVSLISIQRFDDQSNSLFFGKGEATEEIRAFLRAIAEDREPPVTGLDGLKAVLIAQAADISAREGRPVKVAKV